MDKRKLRTRLTNALKITLSKRYFCVSNAFLVYRAHMSYELHTLKSVKRLELFLCFIGITIFKLHLNFKLQLYIRIN